MQTCSLRSWDFPFHATYTNISSRYIASIFCQIFDNIQAESIQRNQQVSGVVAMDSSWIKEWLNYFKRSRTAVECEVRSGRTFTSQNEKPIEKVRRIVIEDHRFNNPGKISWNRNNAEDQRTENVYMSRVPAKFACSFRLFIPPACSTLFWSRIIHHLLNRLLTTTTCQRVTSGYSHTEKQAVWH